MDSPDQTDAPPDDWATAMEGRLLAAALPLAESMGWNRRLVDAAAAATGLSAADADTAFCRTERGIWRRCCFAGMTQRRWPPSPPSTRRRLRCASGSQERCRRASTPPWPTRRRRARRAASSPSRRTRPWPYPWGGRRRMHSGAGCGRHGHRREPLFQARHPWRRPWLRPLRRGFSGGEARAEAHLKARIDNVMAFENWKAKLPTPVAFAHNAAALLGRLRYGAAR